MSNRFRYLWRLKMSITVTFIKEKHCTTITKSYKFLIKYISISFDISPTTCTITIQWNIKITLHVIAGLITNIKRTVMATNLQPHISLYIYIYIIYIKRF